MDPIAKLRSHGLRIIDEPLDVNLEIPHVAYVEMKRPTPRPLLFTKPIDRSLGKEYAYPVLMNIFANKEVTVDLLGSHPDHIASRIQSLLHFTPPQGFQESLGRLKELLQLRHIFPKRLRGEGMARIELESLDELPLLKTWPMDGGKFITTGQVYTKALNGRVQNLGLYRLQKFDGKRLGMHWQIHKDGAHFFHEYKEAGVKMPVTIAIGGDPLYYWCGQAPLPPRLFELLLYGFIRQQRPRLVKSRTNEIYVPEDVDFVIEGYVDPEAMELEGPFGDHTGYYTLPEPFPVLEVTRIAAKPDGIFTATVVGKPPVEDKYMGWATERIFLPLLRTTTSDLIDYHMPENGVFHNLILAKIAVRYPAQAKQYMHAFWGVGQMSFVKHAIFVDELAPPLEDYQAIARYIADRITPERLLISEGVVDHLDHSSPRQFEGGKLGIDGTGEVVKRQVEPMEDSTLLSLFQEIDPNVLALRSYLQESANPITVIAYRKEQSVQGLFDRLAPLAGKVAILIVVNEFDDVDNPYLLVWRVANNIDAKRDIRLHPFIMVDGTDKDPELDQFPREWPPEVLCDPEVLDSLAKRGLVELDPSFLRRWGLVR
ncbi:MAG: menaquinone biosynthesis decarboxylase [Nitratiruptor sp.]|nr:menaquinone biosynthesis decarboxylase [Nitratiruptor sp.]NPA84077.1 menaquinone biosynthesis decarboxylase [Campylobacterota bacterium]